MINSTGSIVMNTLAMQSTWFSPFSNPQNWQMTQTYGSVQYFNTRSFVPKCPQCDGVLDVNSEDCCPDFLKKHR